MEPTPAVPPPPSPPERLLCVDVLRGFDMFWIIGGEAALWALCDVRGGAWLAPLGAQFGHVDWAGLKIYDVIFPLFLFVVGVSVPLSLDRVVATSGRAVAVRRVLRRTTILFTLGVLFYGGFSAPLHQVRWLGVLQRIALCYGAASLLYLALGRRALAVAGTVLLVGYWALLSFAPVPGFGAGDLAEGHNFANWIDARFLPGKPWDGDHDPEGLLSTLPAIVTCLLGVFACFELRAAERSGTQRTWRLVMGGALLLVAGYAWSLQFPLIKKLWTSSFVLVTGGWSMVTLAVFHQVIDVWRLRGWTAPFAWIGANALAIYLLTSVVDFHQVASRLAGGSITLALDATWPGLGKFLVAALAIALPVGLCGFLHRRRIFLRL